MQAVQAKPARNKKVIKSFKQTAFDAFGPKCYSLYVTSGSFPTLFAAHKLLFLVRSRLNSATSTTSNYQTMNSSLFLIIGVISDLPKWQKVSGMGLVTVAIMALVYTWVRSKGMSLIHGQGGGQSDRALTQAEQCSCYVGWILDEARRLGRVLSPEQLGGIVGLIPSPEASDKWFLLVRIHGISQMRPHAEICYDIEAISEHKVLASDIAVALKGKGWSVMTCPSFDMSSRQEGYQSASAHRPAFAISA